MTPYNKKKNKPANRNITNAGSRYHYLIVFLVPFVVLSFSLYNGFVYFDDDILILDNKAKLADITNIGKAFRSDAFFNNSSPYYRPLLNVSLILDAQIAGTNPGFYHFMNLIYHCLCCMVLLWFLRLLNFKNDLALVGTLIFSIHPLIASAVFWIPARNDLLVTLFGLLFLSLSITWIRHRKNSLFAAIILSFTAALFSKESAVLLPFLLILWLILTKQYRPDPGKILLFTGLGIVTTGWYILRMTSITVMGSWQLGTWAVVKNMPFPLEIIAKFFLPVNLAVTPVYTAFYTAIGTLFLVLVAAMFFVQKKKDGWLFVFGILWYIAFSLPNMFVRLDTSPQSYDYLVHRAYLPLAGLLISLLSIVPDSWIRFDKKPVRAGFMVLLIALSVNSVLLGIKYKDANSFWGSAIAYRPEKAWFHHFLGRYYFKQLDYVTFERHLRTAISLDRHPRFLYNLGMICFLEKKSYDSAFLLFNEARATGFTDPEADANFVKLCIESARNFFEKGAVREAAARCRIATELDPGNPVAAYNLGLYLINSGEPGKAASCWRHAISIDPELKQGYFSLYMYYLYNTTLSDSAAYYAGEFKKRGGILDARQQAPPR